MMLKKGDYLDMHFGLGVKNAKDYLKGLSLDSLYKILEDKMSSESKLESLGVWKILRAKDIAHYEEVVLLATEIKHRLFKISSLELLARYEALRKLEKHETEKTAILFKLMNKRHELRSDLIGGYKTAIEKNKIDEAQKFLRWIFAIKSAGYIFSDLKLEKLYIWTVRNWSGLSHHDFWKELNSNVIKLSNLSPEIKIEMFKRIDDHKEINIVGRAILCNGFNVEKLNEAIFFFFINSHENHLKRAWLILAILKKQNSLKPKKAFEDFIDLMDQERMTICHPALRMFVGQPEEQELLIELRQALSFANPDFIQKAYHQISWPWLKEIILPYLLPSSMKMKL